MWPACGWAMLVQGRDCEGQEWTVKVTEQGGRDADRIENLSSVPMMEVARPLCQRIQSSCVKEHGLLYASGSSIVDCGLQSKRQKRRRAIDGRRSRARPSGRKTAPFVPSTGVVWRQKSANWTILPAGSKAVIESMIHRAIRKGSLCGGCQIRWNRSPSLQKAANVAAIRYSASGRPHTSNFCF